MCVCVSVCGRSGRVHAHTQHTAPGRIPKRKVRGSEENILYVLTLSGLSLFLNTVACWSKDQRTYGLTPRINKRKNIGNWALRDSLRCMATVILRAPGDHESSWETLWNPDTLRPILQTKSNFINRRLTVLSTGSPCGFLSCLARDNSKRVEICLHHLCKIFRNDKRILYTKWIGFLRQKIANKKGFNSTKVTAV